MQVLTTLASMCVICHRFYQHVPNSSEWQWGLVWGHAKSQDLVNWEHLPVALEPTPNSLDQHGCFSGCATVDVDGRPTILYTGVSAGRVPPVGLLRTGWWGRWQNGLLDSCVIVYMVQDGPVTFCAVGLPCHNILWPDRVPARRCAALWQRHECYIRSPVIIELTLCRMLVQVIRKEQHEMEPGLSHQHEAQIIAVATDLGMCSKTVLLSAHCSFDTVSSCRLDASDSSACHASTSE